MITQERCHELLEYRDGSLYWKISTTNSIRVGDRAGGNSRDRRTIGIDGERYMEHRIIFLMHHGWLPDEVDHVDTNPSNNRISNLRAATHSENAMNVNLRKDNLSGVKGISWCDRDSKWFVKITVNKKQINLGRFSDIEDAKKVLEEYRKKLHGEFANNG